MKTIALEQVDARIVEALKDQRREDPILLTKDNDALGVLLRLPEGTKETDVDVVMCLEEPMGEVLIILRAKNGAHPAAETPAGEPVYGGCKGMMSIVAEDNEHLDDFEEYMT